MPNLKDHKTVKVFKITLVSSIMSLNVINEKPKNTPKKNDGRENFAGMFYLYRDEYSKESVQDIGILTTPKKTL